ncbi:MAG: HEAT repeat domain-containing protein [Myxococcales bacterium]|nr:HEAT repeat domain-containing protein [Myxococcales bacterium]
MAKRPDPKATLEAIFDADRQLRLRERELLAGDEKSVAELLSREVQQALELEDLEESSMRCQRLADLCAQVPGPAMVDALIALIDLAPTSARVEAYDALLDAAYDRYAEVARGIERALDNERHLSAMGELAFLLAEVQEPSALPLIARVLKIDDVRVQASAIEALVTLGDAAAIEHLEAFEEDERQLPPDPEDPGFEQGTLGELAAEAIEALEQSVD